MAIADPRGLSAKEETSPELAIPRLPTARTAFVGRTLRGPLGRALTVESFAEFQQRFGGLWQPSPLSYAVEQFFDHGGRRAIVVRVANGAGPATLVLPAGAQALTLEALSPGTREFLRASVDYDNVPADDVQRFNLTVQRVRVPGGNRVEDQEIYPLLSVEPGAERFVGRALERSALVKLRDPAPNARPDATGDARQSGVGWVLSGADGDDGAPLTDYDIVGSEREGTGLHALERIDGFELLCIPPLGRETDVGPIAWLAALRYCRRRRALLLIDPPAAWHTGDEALRGLRDFDFASEQALMVYPRILAHDKLRGHFEAFAPSGAAAGLLARSDEPPSPWAPGRSEELVLRPGFRPACLVSEDRRVRLEQHGVNTLQAVRSVARLGVRARTLAAGTASSAEARLLAARRFTLFVVNSIEHGTRWVRGRLPLEAEQAAQVARAVREFFEGLHAEGAFGDRPSAESYVVRTELEEEGRRLRIVIGFAASRQAGLTGYCIVHRAQATEVRTLSLDRRHLLEYSPEELEWVDRLARQLRDA